VLTQEPIKTTRSTVASLPLWYQAMAEVLAEQGRVIIEDEKPKKSLAE